MLDFRPACARFSGMRPLNEVQIRRRGVHQDNSDVMDALQALAGKYGSGAQAAVELIRNSPEFETVRSSAVCALDGVEMPAAGSAG